MPKTLTTDRPRVDISALRAEGALRPLRSARITWRSPTEYLPFARMHMFPPC